VAVDSASAAPHVAAHREGERVVRGQDAGVGANAGKAIIAMEISVSVIRLHDGR
jgi:hypothetical protein